MSFFWLILLFLGFSLCCDFLPGVEYSCIPCGGIYSCHGTGACFANSGDVPGCNLPSGAEDWMCCRAIDCSVSGSNVCEYTPPISPSSSPIPAQAAPIGGSDNSSLGLWIFLGLVLGLGLFFVLVLGIVVVVFIVRKEQRKKEQYNSLISYDNKQ